MNEHILRLLYPNRCPVCEEILAPRDKRIHKQCRKQLVFILEPKCLRCGKPIEQEEQEFCFDCSSRSFHYMRGFPCLKYDQKMSKSLSAFKYKGRREYVDFYVEEMLHQYEETYLRLNFDVLIPIPIHSSKYQERGFNQAEVIANGLGQRLHIPVVKDLLIRNRKTLPQKELNEKERQKNLEQAFEVRLDDDNIKYSRVLLVDDIYTTGSTIEACAKLLVEKGISEVYYTSVCIGHGF